MTCQHIFVYHIIKRMFPNIICPSPRVLQSPLVPLLSMISVNLSMTWLFWRQFLKWSIVLQIKKTMKCKSFSFWSTTSLGWHYSEKMLSNTFRNPYRAKSYIDLGQSLFYFYADRTYTPRLAFLRGLPNSSSSFEKLQPPESFLKCLAALASCFSHNSPPCFKANFQTSHIFS